MDFVHQALPVAKQAILNDVLPVAESVVKELAKGELSGADKRAAAVASITDALKEAQKDVQPDLINLAIELAYQKIKNAVSAPAQSPAL